MTTKKAPAKKAPAKKAAKKAPAPPPAQRVPYEERWQAFSDEEKHRIADGHVMEIDELVRGLTDPTDPIADEELAALIERELAVLDTLTARIEATNAHIDRLIAQRKVTFAKLVLAGEPLSAIARRSNATPMVVSFALGISTKSR